MSRRKRYERAVSDFIDKVCAHAPEIDDALTHDQVLEMFLDFRNAVELSPLRAKVPFSRPCYDKPHRCPGWAGGAWRFAVVKRCESGSLARIEFRRRYWLGARCPKCGLYVLPIVTKWFDLDWWRFFVKHPQMPHWMWRWHWRLVRNRWRKRRTEGN